MNTIAIWPAGYEKQFLASRGIKLANNRTGIARPIEPDSSGGQITLRQIQLYRLRSVDRVADLPTWRQLQLARYGPV